jgi:energy-coupling factor transporter ATP-binding protein EcfA2
VKLLNRIILVQWYLLEAIQIDIEGNTAIVGPNAAGKSSILDAVQAVLMGGNMNMIRLNASAGERSKRSLMEYCLGMVRDNNSADDNDSDLQPRQSATSYIILSFKDDDTQEETAIGLAMHAQLAGRVFEIDGRFIAPKSSLILRDFIEQSGDGEMPIPWERVKANLRQRCKIQGSELQLMPDGERFIREIGEALSYQGRSFEPKRFAKNLQNAITFSPKLFNDVSQFVRRYILDDHPIKVKELQDSLRRYRDIETKTKEVKAKIDSLKIAQIIYGEAARQIDRALQYEWIEKEATVLRLDEEHAELENQLVDLAKQQDAIREKFRVLATATIEDNAKIKALEIQIQLSNVEAKRKELLSRQQTESERKVQAENSINTARLTLSGVYNLLDYKAFLSGEIILALERIKSVIPNETELLSSLWPDNPELIQKTSQLVASELSERYTQLDESLRQRSQANKYLEQRLIEIRGQLETLNSGKTPLSPNTQSLQELLSSRNIESKPLCDLIEINDERWRDAVERYLGGLREALIVAPGDAANAVRFYRKEGRDKSGKPFYGARIVNTRKTTEWVSRVESGSLAEVVTTDDPHARAYINRLLCRVIRVESEDELLEHERAITTDGMLTANGSIEKMRPEISLIGRAAREFQKQNLEGEFSESAKFYADEHSRLSKVLDEKNQANSLPAKLLNFCNKLSDTPNLVELVSKREAALGEHQRLQVELEQLDTRDLDALKLKANALSEAIKNRKNNEEEPLAARNLNIAKEVGEKESRKNQRAIALQTAIDSRTRCVQVPGFRQDAAANQFENFIKEFPEDYARIENIAHNRADNNRRDRAKNLDQARDLTREYALRYSALLPSAENMAPEDMHLLLEQWVLKNLNELEETELAGLTSQAENARNQAEQIFRSKFVGLLRDNLARIDDSLDELNRNLKKREFHGEYYTFKKETDPEFAPLVSWIQSVTKEDQANVGGLFDKADNPDSEHFDASHKIQQLLLGGSEGVKEIEERLADYRNYFRFDVEMRDKDGRNRTTLSQRLGKGSGGEHQAPFYVAIGAALAATYRIERDHEGALHGGMALALFDEAFSKLDMQNTLNSLAFLRDLGMQVLIAAPDEKYALLAGEMDTMIRVYRYGGYVSIDPEYLKPAARELLSSDNPYKQSVSNG